MKPQCINHASPEFSFRTFVENVIDSVSTFHYRKVYDIRCNADAVDMICHVVACPVCSKSSRIDVHDKSIVKYKKLEEGAKMPFKAYSTDAAFDLYSLYTIDLLPGIVTQVHTGIAFEMPNNMYATLEARSSFHSKGIHTNRGIIDAGYRGEVSGFLVNNTDATWTIKRWERFSQIIFHHISPVSLLVADELTPSERGQGRLGSTGKM
jgi:dUTP pyrophosphatase